MLKIFYKNDGVISVFLTLILLPVILVGCLTVDGSRIYMSKPIISDAGEMALNAGLAQYDMDLKDEYGLMAMEKTPESMNDELKEYFHKSLTGADESLNYDYLLKLVDEDFRTINIEASKLYNTEVEKQQIIEYMKYRAPACIAELVVDKIKEIKGAKKMADAMEAEMDFGESVEDCLDAFDKLKEVLVKLNDKLNTYPELSDINKELNDTGYDFINNVSRYQLMMKGLSEYDEFYQDYRSADCEKMKKYVEDFNDSVLIFSQGGIGDNTYNAYIKAIKCENTIQKLGGIGGIIKRCKEESKAEDSEEESESASDNSELDNLKSTYNARKKIYSSNTYINDLRSSTAEIVNSHCSRLSACIAASKVIQAYINYDLKEALSEVRSSIEEAHNKYVNWDNKVEQLEGQAKTDMKTEVEEYADIFELDELDLFKYNMDINNMYLDDVISSIEKEKYYDNIIADADTVTNQINSYAKNAESLIISKKTNEYDTAEKIRNIATYECGPKFVYSQIESEHNLYKIENDEFYKKVMEYTEVSDEPESKEKKDTVNKKINEGQSGLKNLLEIEGNNFNWDGYGEKTLPSSLIGASSKNVDSVENEDVDIGDKSSRRKAMSKSKEQFSQMGNFLDKLGKILSEGVTNLYIVEYGMQMFSYYTVDKNPDGTEIPVDNVRSLSGCKLSDHPAYKSEAEYMLWGHDSSNANISQTLGIIAGIRMMFNSFFAFTDTLIRDDANNIARVIAPTKKLLQVVIKLVYKTGLGIIETGNDIIKIKDGHGVTILKNKKSWASSPHWEDNTSGITLDYSEYLRIFMWIHTLGGLETSLLARIADCIQVNTDKDCDITQKYTMLGIESHVSIKTSFMRKISEWSNSNWENGDSYIYTYQSIMGY